MDHNGIRSVLITGGRGNLGSKLASHLLTQPWCERLVILDVPFASAREEASGNIAFVSGDLADAGDRRWHDAMNGIDAVVHFAAQNPYPDAPWSDAAVSLDMTLNVLAGAAKAGVRRVVFASSNHVMGQYKDPPLADVIEAGSLTTGLEPGPGTRWFNGERMVQGSAYAASKLMGERACLAAAKGSAGRLTSVSVRIGWCQPGENRPPSTPPACPVRPSARTPTRSGIFVGSATCGSRTGTFCR